jgi:hypothetical protein
MGWPVTLLLEASLAQRTLAVFRCFIVRFRLIIVDCKRTGEALSLVTSLQQQGMDGAMTLLLTTVHFNIANY